jgi:hypothetical protein
VLLLTEDTEGETTGDTDAEKDAEVEIVSSVFNILPEELQHNRLVVL